MRARAVLAQEIAPGPLAVVAQRSADKFLSLFLESGVSPAWLIVGRLGGQQLVAAGRFGTQALVAAGRVGLPALVAVLLAGCGPPAAIRTFTALRAYWPGAREVGEPFRDFGFTDAVGQVTRFSAVHGRVTVLAFSADPNWPNYDEARPLAELAARESTCWIDVVVVSVGHPTAPCAEVLQRVAGWQVPPEQLVLVCDQNGTVAPLYGPAAEGRYYVLTNFLKIAAIGELSDLDGLRAATERVVDQIYDQDLREGLYQRFGNGW